MGDQNGMISSIELDRSISKKIMNMSAIIVEDYRRMVRWKGWGSI